MDAERERKTRELLAGAKSRSQAKRIAQQRGGSAAENLLRGQEQVAREAEIATCAQCGAQVRRKHGTWIHQGPCAAPRVVRVNVLCGCGWGALNRAIDPGEIIECPMCGTELGHE